jgi:diaminohydroxyphosphoribosylaminopyrimidine deaminase / 5-amino-6-(5-phosphoribosylamino)uracil reductase
LTDTLTEDRRWLDAAVRLATPHLGTTNENPAAGALVVRDGVLVGRGVPPRGGRPHAAHVALEQAGEAARGATIYVTIEPCNTWDRTPPCSDTIIRAGVSRVVIGITDPDKTHQGESIEKFRGAGLDVVVLDHEPSRRLHQGFVLRLTEDRPSVTLKLSVSADGKIGHPAVGNLAIAGEPARRWTHMQRALADAVLVGGATAEVDDPKLMVGLKGLEDRTALRVILSGSTLDTSVNLIASLSGYPIAILSTTDTVPDVPASVEVITVEGVDGHPDLGASLHALSKKGINCLLVESGARATEAFLASGFVDRFHLITSTVIIGDSGVPATAAASIEDRLLLAGLAQVDQRALGDDLLRTFERP